MACLAGPMLLPVPRPTPFLALRGPTLDCKITVNCHDELQRVDNPVRTSSACLRSEGWCAQGGRVASEVAHANQAKVVGYAADARRLCT